VSGFLTGKPRCGKGRDQAEADDCPQNKGLHVLISLARCEAKPAGQGIGRDVALS
jgi:hypothetical protein